MAVTEVAQAEPANGERVVVQFTGVAAKSFVEMLNMNKIRDGHGYLVVFSLQRAGDEWVLCTELRTNA